MKEKFENFCKALDRLEEALQEEPVGLNLDAIIQRFEFTYELTWKVLKSFLFRDGIECNSPRDCFKTAFQTGYINNEDLWLEMINDRNLTSHIYDEEQTRSVYRRIKKLYYNEFKLLSEKLKAKLI
jgi:nucleotidyltransferase substrate binding protein (TIGR01987 family)